MQKYEDEPLVAAVLTPYLPDIKDEDGEATQSGLQRTFETLWKLIQAGQEKNWRYDQLQSDPDRLRLLKGLDHKPGLKWEVLGLGDNQGKSPDSVRSKEAKLPQAGVLAAGASNPEWVKAMDGGKVPYAWAAGYEADVPESGDESWQRVPALYFFQHDRQVKLDAGWRDDDHPAFAVPSSRE